MRVCVTRPNLLHTEVKMIRGFVGSDVETHPAGARPLEGDVSPRWQEEDDGVEGAAATGYQPNQTIRLSIKSRDRMVGVVSPS